MRRKVERWKNLFSSSALNHCRLWNRGGGVGSRVDSVVRKGPSEVLLTQMSSRCLMCLWQPWPISAQWWEVGVIKNLRTNVIASSCFPVVWGGFLSPDFLQEEMCTHPARIAINHSSCVGSPHRQDHALRIRQLFHFPEVNARYILNGSYAFLHLQHLSSKIAQCQK